MATRQVTSPSFSRPFVEPDGSPSSQARLWIDAVTLSIPIVGTGNPEGVVEARQTQVFMDDAGTAGAIMYIKRDDNILSDKTKGWILI